MGRREPGRARAFGWAPGGSGPHPDPTGALTGDGGDEAAATRQWRSRSGKTGMVGLARGAVAGAVEAAAGDGARGGWRCRRGGRSGADTGLARGRRAEEMGSEGRPWARGPAAARDGACHVAV